MDLKQFNAFMKRCADIFSVRYVTPTIHPKFRQIVAIKIETSYETKVFSVTNHPDENFNLDREINLYLDSLENKKVKQEN